MKWPLNLSFLAESSVKNLPPGFAEKTVHATIHIMKNIDFDHSVFKVDIAYEQVIIFGWLRRACDYI